MCDYLAFLNFMLRFRTIIIGLTVLSCGIPSVLASDNFTFTGAITGINAYVRIEEGKVVERRISMTVSLQLQNVSDEPLIVFVPNRVPGPRKLEFLSPSGAVGDTATIGPFVSSQYESSILERLFETLVKASEPGDYTAIVPPSGYYQFTDYLSFDTGYEIDEETALKSNAARKKYVEENKWARTKQDEEPRSFACKVKSTKFPSLRIEYRLSSGKFVNDPELLSLVKVRWKRFGDLPLNNGDYLLTTDAIPNDPRFISQGVGVRF